MFDLEGWGKQENLDACISTIDDYLGDFVDRIVDISYLTLVGFCFSEIIKMYVKKLLEKFTKVKKIVKSKSSSSGGNYVEKEKGKHIPQERGRILTAFLNNFFGKYIEYDFTADLEKQLDKVSDGKLNYKNLLKEFWDGFKPHLSKMSELERDKILEALEKELAELFFPTDDLKNGAPNRKCPTCSNGNLGLELGKYGAFIGCSNYPECKFTKQIASNQDKDENNTNDNFIPDNDRILGIDPVTGLNVFIKKA